jgi:hypothetical protein
MKLKLATVAGSLAAAALVSFAAPSYAALEACPASFTADGTAKVHDGGGAPILTAASMCQYVTPADTSNVASITNINTAGFFGFSDWQANSPEQGQIDANASTGTWSISNVNFALYDYIMVFKDGQETNLIAFLFNEAFSSGVAISRPTIFNPRRSSRLTISPISPRCTPSGLMITSVRSTATRVSPLRSSSGPTHRWYAHYRPAIRG